MMGMCVCIHMCVTHSRSGVPQQEAKSTRDELKNKTTYNGTFSFDTSNDIPPSIIRVMNSQLLN